ncbi:MULTISPECIES: nucleoside hydrolase [unclassified Massilia]|uniref:nucleoside hydrolase n=1 Tax=unclassified Massilia TaxID=2609279 RepID=UPI00068CF7CB|nr:MULTISPECIES: nucleoside hydrolase [unclassified Massilia]ALK99320.2 twin-arginine translocation pathway signal protein [Massilia sp. WG5]
MKRRTFLSGIAALPASAALGQTFGQTIGSIVQRPSSRVIVDNDFSGDPDSLIALTHQLLTPKARTVLVTTSAVAPGLASMAGLDAGQSPMAATRLVSELMDRLRLAHRPALVGGRQAFGAGKDSDNAAARAIVAEALRDDPLPLVLTCGGPLTNVAAALRLEPRIAKRLKLVWIGGTAATDAPVEYNLATDIAAARYVLEESKVEVWQVAQEEYMRFQLSVAELTGGFRTISPVAEWLYSQYLHLPPFVELGGSIGFGDSAMVSLTAFGFDATPHTLRRARKILDDGRYGAEIDGSSIRMVHGFDVRLNLSDLVALLRAHKVRHDTL